MIRYDIYSRWLVSQLAALLGFFLGVFNELYIIYSVYIYQ